jgi:protein SCO1/2
MCAACAVLAVALDPLVPLLAHEDPSQAINLAPAGWPVGDIALLDPSGNPFTRDRLVGRWTFLLLRDRSCAASCADALSALTGLRRRIAGTAALRSTQVVVAVLRSDDQVGDGHQLIPEGAQAVVVTGPPAGLDALEEELGIAAAPRHAPGGGSLWLIGPDAVVRAQLLPPYDVPALTAAYLKMRLRG